MKEWLCDHFTHVNQHTPTRIPTHTHTRVHTHTHAHTQKHTCRERQHATEKRKCQGWLFKKCVVGIRGAESTLNISI